MANNEFCYSKYQKRHRIARWVDFYLKAPYHHLAQIQTSDYCRHLSVQSILISSEPVFVPSVLIKHIPGDSLNKVISSQFCPSPVVLEHLCAQWNPTPLKTSFQTLPLQENKMNHDLLSLFSLLFFKPITPFFQWYIFNGNFIFILVSAWKACETSWC